jgi:hypothetical protein
MARGWNVILIYHGLGLGNLCSRCIVSLHLLDEGREGKLPQVSPKDEDTVGEVLHKVVSVLQERCSFTQI